MDHRQRGLDCRVEEITIKGSNLAGIQHAFVNNGLVREARHIKHAALGDGGSLDRVLDAPADHVELAFEGELIIQAGGRPPFFWSTAFALNENLTVYRRDAFGGGPERGVLGWYGPPP